MARALSAAAPRRPIRLLWVIDSLTAGGAEALVGSFSRALDPARLRLHVCTLKTLDGNPFQSDLEAEGMEVTNLEARNLRDFAALRRLIDLIRDEAIDLVHAHLTYAIIWGCLAARWTGRPCVATLHTTPGEWPWNSRNGVRQRLMCAAMNRWCDRVVAVSGAVRRAFEDLGSADVARMVVVPNGVEVERLAEVPAGRTRRLRERLGLPTEAKVVTTVAVLRHGKGLETLLAAARRVVRRDQRVVFLVAGDGPLRSQLESLGRDLGLADRIHWLGFRRDIPELLAASDLFVLPSLWDAYPTSLMEAMAAGLPAVATAVGGIPEIVSSPETGSLVPPGDPEALAVALLELLAEPRRAAELGEAARRHACAEFSTRTWVERLDRLYDQVLAASGQPSRAEAVL